MVSEDAQKIIQAALNAPVGNVSPQHLEALNSLVRTAQEAEVAQSLRDHEERMAKLKADEQGDVRKGDERREIRKIWVAGVSFVMAFVTVFILVRALPPEKQPDAVEKILTAFLGAIPGALAGYLFGKDDKSKKKGDGE